MALLTDAVHLFSDVASLILALVVMRIMALPKSHKMSYGYQRAEILGALISSLFLIMLCGFLIYEAILRFIYPTSVNGEIVFVIALFGLLANIWMMRILHPIQEQDFKCQSGLFTCLG